MHTDEWIAKESKEDKSKTFGFSLKQSNYKLPMIKLTFGSEYIPVPQNQMVTLMLSEMNPKQSLKKMVYSTWCRKAADELGISREELKKTLEDGKGLDGKGSEAEYKIFSWIEEKIRKEGPYEVLGRALMDGYYYEADSLYQNIEEQYDGEIGEEQEWDKDGDKER